MKGRGRLNPIPLKKEQAFEGSANRLFWGGSISVGKDAVSTSQQSIVVKKKKKKLMII